MALVIFDNLCVRQLGLRRDHLIGKQDLLPGCKGLLFVMYGSMKSSCSSSCITALSALLSGARVIQKNGLTNAFVAHFSTFASLG